MYQLLTLLSNLDYKMVKFYNQFILYKLGIYLPKTKKGDLKFSYPTKNLNWGYKKEKYTVKCKN